MRRRALLAHAAATSVALGTLGLAGCLNDPSSGDGTGTERSTTTTSTSTAESDTVSEGDTVTLDSTAFELGSPRLQSTFVDQRWPFWDAVGDPDRVYVAVPLDPTTDDGGAAEVVRNARIRAEFDGDRVTDPGEFSVNRDDQHSVLLGVPLPAGSDTDDIAIRFGGDGGARLELDADQRAYVADPPTLSVDPRIPEETEGNALTVGLDVTNEGERDGILAWTTTHSYIADAWWTHRSTIPAGETRTVEQEWNRLGSPDSGSKIGVRLDWGYDDRQQDIVVARD